MSTKEAICIFYAFQLITETWQAPWPPKISCQFAARNTFVHVVPLLVGSLVVLTADNPLALENLQLAEPRVAVWQVSSGMPLQLSLELKHYLL